MKQAGRDIAARLDHGVDETIATIAELGAISQEDASAVFAAYVKHRLMRRDFITGRWAPKHGAYYDRETIQNAARNLKEGRA